MEIERLEEKGVTVVAVRGVINFGESARQFSSYLADLLDSGVRAVVVDMSGIDHVDSTGLGELVGYLQRFEKEGRRLALLRPHRRILSRLRLTRLDEHGLIKGKTIGVDAKPKTLQDLSEGFLAIMQGLWRALEHLLQRHTIERGPDVNTRADPIAAAV